MEIHQWTNTFCGGICSLLSKDNCAKEEEWNCNFKSDHVAVCNNYEHWQIRLSWVRIPLQWTLPFLTCSIRSPCLRVGKLPLLPLLKSSCCRVRKPGLDHKRIRSSMKGKTLPSAALSPSCTGEAIYMFWSLFELPDDCTSGLSWWTQLIYTVERNNKSVFLRGGQRKETLLRESISEIRWNVHRKRKKEEAVMAWMYVSSQIPMLRP